MAEKRDFEVIIVGGGIAGASLAYFLTERGVTDIAVLEREAQHGYHATGRSAATLVEWDSIPTVQRLKALGGEFLKNPPTGFAENPLVDHSQVMLLYRDGNLGEFSESAAGLRRDGVEFRALSGGDAIDRVPALEPGDSARAILLTGDGRIDIHELLTNYLRNARRAGAVIRVEAEVCEVIVEDGRCSGVATAKETLRAKWIVDAAGAWAGEIAKLAGASQIRLEPRRRSIVLFDPAPGIDIRGWPFVISEADQVYFAPESGGLMLSPMDQVPMAPCDAQPDDETIAAAMERLRMLAPRLVPRALKRRWAGLRTFSPDSIPVVGEDPRLPGFFWLAGQAGFGIESSGAIGQIAADLIANGSTKRFDAALLSPARFAAK
ncbi:MAG: NAD(P)/FAD-dependent oxidoreductase [Candidatus Binataceae bacterium]